MGSQGRGRNWSGSGIFSFLGSARLDSAELSIAQLCLALQTKALLGSAVLGWEIDSDGLGQYTWHWLELALLGWAALA